MFTIHHGQACIKYVPLRIRRLAGVENMPYYVFEEFRTACSGADAALRVFINNNAERDAARDFKLKGKAEIRNLIAEGGLEDLAFQNSALLEKNPYKHDVYIDAYNFISGFTSGYIAFYCIKKSEKAKWMIKSFKKSDRVLQGSCGYELDGGESMRLALSRLIEEGRRNGN